MLFGSREAEGTKRQLAHESRDVDKRALGNNAGKSARVANQEGALFSHHAGMRVDRKMKRRL